MKNLSITFAQAKDETCIRNLLSEADLPFLDVGEHLPNFIIARDKGQVIGAVGIERLGKVGLLRSLVIAPRHRGKGIGTILYDRILAYADLIGIKKLYLLTTTAENFFTKVGFTKIERGNIPRPIQLTKEFQSLCPETAVCMVKTIEKKVKHYPREILRLQRDVPGAELWGIALEKVMFTYFEIQPYTTFERHRHRSEQITFVLEGKLFFEAVDSTVCVNAGDVIAIPSNVAHAAYTKEEWVKAIDAWSPVRRKLLKRSANTDTTPLHD
ncbi:MAG: GNAT family N-acetyltransferase [candidate division WOR-3 bacterium]|nr:MAG: GNAT family N-acetyltransferase [candidate division WOR-3 bacterium]